MSAHVPRPRRGLAALGALGLAFSAIAISAQPGFAAADHDRPEAPAFHGKHTYKASSSALAAYGATDQMTYHDGPVQDDPKVYVVYWGSQWGNGKITNDPRGEAPLLESFYSSLYGAGDNWSTSTTQYCSGVASGSTDCAGAQTFVGHPSTNPLGGTWLDDSAPAPAGATDQAIANEAVAAAEHFGVSGTNVQVIVAFPDGVNPDGFGPGGYCAWHNSFYLPSGGTITATNLPYLAGYQGCGNNTVSVGTSGVDAGTEAVTLAAGHEYAETVTDPLPPSGWIADNDGTGGENGDKCTERYAEPGIVSLNGKNFAVQALWSNNANNNVGGCVLHYNSPTDQG